MIGEIAFQLFGARWSGIRRLSDAIAASPQCILHRDQSFANFLTGKAPEDESDGETRVKLRIDNFQKACWHKAGEKPELKWGHQTMMEDIGRLLDEPGSEQPAVDNGWTPVRGKFNAVDYFICRCFRVPAVVIIRDGRAMIPMLIDQEKLPAAAAVARWKFSIHVMRRVINFTQKSHVIRFEDLVREPQDTMRQVSDFLGIQYADRMIKDLLPGARNALTDEEIDPGMLAARTADEPWAQEIASDLDVCGYLE
jgi:hypothetical protein